MMRFPVIAMLCLAGLTAAGETSEFRRFSDGHKRTVYARPVAVIGEGRVLLENEAGAQFETPLEVLSAADRRWFAEWERRWRKQAARAG